MPETPKAKPAKIPDYVYIETVPALHAAVHKLRQQAVSKPRTIDSETTGHVPFVDRLKVIQIGVPGQSVFVIQIERIPESEWGPLRDYLAEARESIFQNGKFDLKMLEAEGLSCGGTVRDTLLRSKLYHLGDRLIKHDLKALSFKWCGLEIDKTAQTSFVADNSREPLTRSQKDYAALDVDTTARVDAALAIALQNRRAKRPGILAHVEREERFLPLLARLENEGVLVARTAVATVTAAIKHRMEQVETELLPILQPNLKQLKLKLGHKPGFVPTKLQEEQIKSAFRLEDAQTKTLLRVAHRQPEAKLVLEHAALWRQLNCCNELLQKRNGTTGRWHADHAQIENLQGSLGPSKLKVELLERLTKSWRAEPLLLLQPDDGYEVLDVSFPDLELTLLAHYSQDPQLQQELASGESPVAVLVQAIAASKMAFEPYDHTMLALVTWHGNGILNQKGLYLQAWLYSEHGLVLDPPQIKALQSLIPARYPTLAKFQHTITKMQYEERVSVLGTLRLWSQASPKDLRNFLIWSSFSELLKECVCWLQPCCTTFNSRVAFIGEQSLLLEVPKGQTEALTEAVLETLADQLSQHCPQIAVTITVSSLEK